VAVELVRDTISRAIDVMVSREVDSAVGDNVSKVIRLAISFTIGGAIHREVSDEIMEEVFNAVSNILRGTIGLFDDEPVRNTVRKDAIQPT
jgi:hypothetical protein